MLPFPDKIERQRIIEELSLDLNKSLVKPYIRNKYVLLIISMGYLFGTIFLLPAFKQMILASTIYATLKPVFLFSSIILLLAIVIRTGSVLWGIHQDRYKHGKLTYPTIRDAAKTVYIVSASVMLGFWYIYLYFPSL